MFVRRANPWHARIGLNFALLVCISLLVARTSLRVSAGERPRGKRILMLHGGGRDEFVLGRKPGAEAKRWMDSERPESLPPVNEPSPSPVPQSLPEKIVIDYSPNNRLANSADSPVGKSESPLSQTPSRSKEVDRITWSSAGPEMAPENPLRHFGIEAASPPTLFHEASEPSGRRSELCEETDEVFVAPLPPISPREYEAHDNPYESLSHATAAGGGGSTRRDTKDVHPPGDFQLQPIRTTSPNQQALPVESMRNWVFTGIAQAIGTLIGLLLGVLLFVAVMLVFRGRESALKFEPIIRVEMPGSSQPAYSEWAGRGADANPPSESTIDHSSTPVADFSEQGVAWEGVVLSYEEQRQAKMAQQEHQQMEILKQVFEDNITLQRELDAA